MFRTDTTVQHINWFAAFGVALALFLGSGQAAAQEGDFTKANPDHPRIYDPDIAARSSDPTRPPAYGPEDAEVRVLIFSDYQCPACRRMSPATQQISAEFPGDVRIELWHHALAMHKSAEIAAAAAVAAQRQGKFWEMHDKLIAYSGPFNAETLETLAAELDLDLERFRLDMNDPAVIERIRHEGETADALGAGNTPGIVINGKVSRGWASWPAFRGKVERELKEALALAQSGLDAAQIQDQRAASNLEDPEKLTLYRARVLQVNQQSVK